MTAFAEINRKSFLESKADASNNLVRAARIHAFLDRHLRSDMTDHSSVSRLETVPSYITLTDVLVYLGYGSETRT